MMRMKTLGALLLGSALALAGCKGSDGSAGANGTNGSNGTNGTNGTWGTTSSKLKLVINDVVTANNVATLTFTVYPAAAVCPNAALGQDPSTTTCDDQLRSLGQKTFYGMEYDANARAFNKTRVIAFPTSLSASANPKSTVHFKQFTADGKGAQYTVTAAATYAIESSTSAFVYGYIATPGAVPAPSTGHYSLPSSVSSASKVYGTISYSSYANVSGCEKCHNKPYSKHGYRQATVAGLPDFVSCKACHYDDTAGEDGQWFVFADDPASYDPDVWDTVKYAYKKNIMNDVHNSHAFEFNYPQFMNNCVTCHAGKLAQVTDDSCFRPSVCKSCHPVTGVAGTQEGRAPALLKIIPHAVGNLYTASETACTGCHVTGNTLSPAAPTFAQIHPGFNERAYKDATLARFDASISTTCTGATYDEASYIATVTFSVTGVSSTAAVIKPTVVGGLYGYDTKDFIIGGHSSISNKRALEFTPGDSRNSPRLVVTQDPNDKTVWTAVADLSTWSSMITAGQVKRMEMAFLPEIGIDPNAVVTTLGGNPPAAVGGIAQTIALKTSSDARVGDGNSYGKKIVDPKKCQACHDALGTYWWHAPKNGSAGVVGCRLCHAATTAAGYYEMQSRSIDSFLHGAHQMEVSEITAKYDPTNAVTNIRYEKWVEGNFPNFAGPLNCEACHYANTYNPPDQSKSLPGVISGTGTPLGVASTPTRTGLPVFAAQVVGPAARACGGCHRAQALNELDGNKLAAFMAHTSDFGSAVFDATALVSTAAYVEYMIGGSTTSIAAPAGAQVEQCVICHARSGSEHQSLFNIWKAGIQQ